MALIQCPECGREVSDQATACPCCAYPIKLRPTSLPVVDPVVNKEKSSRGFHFGWLALVPIVVAVVFIRSIFNEPGRLPGPSTPYEPPSASRSESVPWKMGPKIRVTIQKTEYEQGYFKVVGVAENIGDKATFSPTLVLEIFEQNSRTLLAKDQAWPTGTLFKDMEPGSSAAFTHFVSVPGEPQNVRWRVTVSNFPSEVIKEKE